MTPPSSILVGDCRDVLRTLPERSVQTVVTSPPYFGLRDYGTGEWDGGDPACDHVERMARGDNGRPTTEVPRGAGGAMVPSGSSTPTETPIRYRGLCLKCGACRVDRQIGLEPTPDEFVQALVGVFREVRRVLRDDGTVWLNLGDSYAGNSGGEQGQNGDRASCTFTGTMRGSRGGDGLKPKDLIGVPWMVAFALRADGWYLRSDIVWSKPNPMPESVTDRPTKSHEYVFLLSKGPRYFYDADAIREPHEAPRAIGRLTRAQATPGDKRERERRIPDVAGRNKRSVWTVATQPYAGAHFATFPPRLIEPCILAGAPKGAMVLDPFAGAGTTGVAAGQLGRAFTGIELNPEYAHMARERIALEGRPGGRPATHTPTVPLDGQLPLLA